MSFSCVDELSALLDANQCNQWPVDDEVVMFNCGSFPEPVTDEEFLESLSRRFAAKADEEDYWLELPDERMDLVVTPTVPDNIPIPVVTPSTTTVVEKKKKRAPRVKASAVGKQRVYPRRTQAQRDRENAIKRWKRANRTEEQRERDRKYHRDWCAKKRAKADAKPPMFTAAISL